MLSVKDLKAEIVRNGETVKSVALKLGIDRGTFYRKMNGVSDFTRADIQKLVETLKLSNADAMRIFFADEVA